MDEPVLFHLSGVRLGDGLARPDPSLRPALFARLGDLTRIRHDFPLVLAPDGDVRPLSRIVDDLLADITSAGPAGDRTRRVVLRVERRIRELLALGKRGSLAQLWVQATEDVTAARGAAAVADLDRAWGALRIDGDVVDCGPATGLRIVRHMWRAEQGARTRALRARIGAAAARLRDLVEGDLNRSGAGRRPERLRASLAGPHRSLFDFDLMAHLLATPSGPTALPPRRRRRIEDVLVALRRADAFAAALAEDGLFDLSFAAQTVFTERRHAMANALRALAVGELEAAGAYREDVHDAQIARGDDEWLTPAALALFPDLLVRVSASGVSPRAQLLEALTSGAPMKVIFETDDAIGVDAQLASSAMGLGDVFVVQSASAHLGRMTAPLRAAIAHHGPALISVFTGAPEGSKAPAYLVSAAAMTSRAFPAFTYDPGAGPDWRERFALVREPQPERTWPAYELRYAGRERRRERVDIAFTVADLALCDPRRASQLAQVADGRWDPVLASVPEALDVDARVAGRAPFVRAIDAGGRLRTVLVDQRLLQATRHAAQAWHRLVELDDLKAERVAVATVPPPQTAAVTDTAAAVSPPAAPPDRDPDTAWIETARCSTCNECTQQNPRMFAYNDDRQAYIKDIGAGTYRDLVEAAESCQVAIIHPGRPRDPREPGVEELLKRAEPYR